MSNEINKDFVRVVSVEGQRALALNPAKLPPISTPEVQELIGQLIARAVDANDELGGIAGLVLARLAYERDQLFDFASAVKEGWELRGPGAPGPSQSSKKTLN